MSAPGPSPSAVATTDRDGGPRSATSSIRNPFLRASLVAFGAAPFLLPLARAMLPLGAAGERAHDLFAVVCHQRADRTLALAGVPMPVCSRCAGIYAGVALAAALARPRLSARSGRWLLALAAALMVLDVALQELDLHPIWHAARLTTGALFGFAAVLLVLAYLAPRAEGTPAEAFVATAATKPDPEGSPICGLPRRDTR